MVNKAGKTHLLMFFAVIIGLGLVFGITEVRAQTSKAIAELNNASDKDLEGIKGVGSATAKKIIASRPYRSADDLKKAGISDKAVESMKSYVKVGAAPAATKPTGEAKSAVSKKPLPRRNGLR